MKLNEDFEMSEERMLLTGLASMMVVSVIVAAGLFFAGAGPLAVIFGGTAAGAITYAVVCLRSTPYVKKTVIPEHEDEALENAHSNDFVGAAKP